MGDNGKEYVRFMSHRWGLHCTFKLASSHIRIMSVVGLWITQWSAHDIMRKDLGSSPHPHMQERSLWSVKQCDRCLIFSSHPLIKTRKTKKKMLLLGKAELCKHLAPVSGNPGGSSGNNNNNNYLWNKQNETQGVQSNTVFCLTHDTQNMSMSMYNQLSSYYTLLLLENYVIIFFSYLIQWKPAQVKPHVAGGYYTRS